MLRPEENALLTQTGSGTPMGALFRRYWLPRCSRRSCRSPTAPRSGYASSAKTSSPSATHAAAWGC